MLRVVLVVVLATYATALSASLDGPKKREITGDGRTPIERLIQPDDEVVVLRPGECGPVGIGRPSIQQVVNAIRHEADVVLLAEIVDTSAHLSEGHTWIVTDLSLYAHDEVFNRVNFTYAEGHRRQQFSVAGGELFVGNALVRTEGMFSVKIGGTYVLCLAKGKSGKPSLHWVYPPLSVDGSRLVSNRSDFVKRYYDPLGGQAVSTIVRLLKKP
jgi:hypothetical protein